MKLPKFYCLYSGGKDSTTTASILHKDGMLESCVAIDTGISTPDWLAFVKNSCEEHGWPLEVYKTSASYDDLVRKYGFPGPGKHGMFMNYLKGRGIRDFKKAHPGKCLASGVRKSESQRRMRFTKEWSLFEDVPVFAPLWDWATEKVWGYFNSNGFVRSPAYATLCISGDCLCGAFATPMERGMIKSAYPEVHERLSKLEAECGGFGWGERSCKSRRKTRQSSPLCVDCDNL